MTLKNSKQDEDLVNEVLEIDKDFVETKQNHNLLFSFKHYLAQLRQKLEFKSFTKHKIEFRFAVLAVFILSLVLVSKAFDVKQFSVGNTLFKPLSSQSNVSSASDPLSFSESVASDRISSSNALLTSSEVSMSEKSESVISGPAKLSSGLGSIVSDSSKSLSEDYVSERVDYPRRPKTPIPHPGLLYPLHSKHPTT